MDKKRGMLLYVVLSLVLSLSFSAGRLSDSSNYREGIIHDSSTAFDYTPALGIKGGNNDDNPCETQSNARFGILQSSIIGNNLNVEFPPEDDEDCSFDVDDPAAGSCRIDGPAQCSWDNLPLSAGGCYFLVSEEDMDSGDDYNPNDCGGWLIPAGEKSLISRTIQPNADNYLITASDDPLALISHGFPAVGITDQFLGIGDYSTEYEATGNQAICVFRAQQFNSPDQAFVCLQQESEYRWYICNEENLYERTGEYIQIEPLSQCQRDLDCATQGEFNLCRGNQCVNSEGQLGIEQGAMAWICTVDTNGEYSWSSNHPLNCDDEDVNCDEERAICLQDPRGFSWAETTSGSNSCCGDDGIADFTSIAESPEGDRVCLSAEGDLVGSASDDFASSSIWTNNLCAGRRWCWINAIGEAAFHILSIKKPGEESYDVISNNKNWVECRDEEGMHDISAPDVVIDPDDIEKANRFYCYQEGNRWSWADCRDEGEATEEALNGPAKLRSPGDGLFAFKLDQLEPTDSVSINLEDVYEPYYEHSTVNFAGMDDLSLEFFVRFTTLEQFPANVILNIFGPEQDGQHIIYYSQPVLGYAVNTPLLEPNQWIHVKVPLPEMIGVTLLRFDVAPTGGRNLMQIRNVYLNSATAPRICSGARSRTAEQSSWLENLDFSSPTSSINGAKLCNVLYDPTYDPALPPEEGKAWLGDYDEISTGDGNNNCCGNNENEYYSEQSREVNGVRYGCWNAQPIASGETAMNVEFEVEYNLAMVEINYPELQLQVDYTQTAVSQEEIRYQCSLYGIDVNYPPIFCHVTEANGVCSEFYEEREIVEDTCTNHYTLNPDENCILQYRRSHSGGIGQYGTLTLPNCRAELEPEDVNLSVTTFSEIPAEFAGLVYIQDTDTYLSVDEEHEIENSYGTTITLSISPKIIGEMTVNRQDFAFGDGYRGKIVLENGFPSNFVDFYFLNADTGEELGTEIAAEDLPWTETGLYIMAKVITEEYPIEVNLIEQENNHTFTFVCNQATGECLYPLPGNPPYHITNLHPDLYELYFVSTDGTDITEKPIFEQNQEFTTPGNIKAKKVAQQVIFLSEGEDAVDEPSFYGCQAAEYVANNVDANLNYCVVRAGKFCSPSVAHDDGRERFTTISSWSNESLTALGYAPIEAVADDVSTFYENTAIPLRTTGTDLPVIPTLRNYSSSVLPARNFISNAEFQRNGLILPHWEIIDANGSIKENVRSNVDDATHIVTLAAGEKLRSERVAIPQNHTISFSQNLTCDTTNIILIDKNGNLAGEVGNTTSIQTETASYLRLEFVGPCSIYQPLLQLIDDLGPASYSYIPQDYPDGFDARAGLSCCPQNYCWNGYACVAPMESVTYLAEHIAEGRDYRCIAGEWKHLPVKYDWNEQRWGFCEQENQCLVLSSTEGASIENTAQAFYQGEYPTCINNGEYILDNLCEQGNWTSRTKFVASKLLEVGETDEYVLYCTNYRRALVELDNRENYVGGDFSQVQETTSTLAATLLGPAEQENLFTCFDQILDPEGRRLVRDEDNTCVNNVCVLQFKEGGALKVAFATTLNKNLTSEDSFLLALNVPQDRLNQVCAGNGSFVQCDLTGLDIPGNLWYSQELNAIVYGKEGIQLDPSLLERIIDWFSNFFGFPSELSDEAAFIERAHNFRELYLLNKEGKRARALQEILPGTRQTLVAEYTYFQTPICAYIQHLQLPPEVQAELLETLSDREKVSCSLSNETQRVEIVAGLNFFWPQLTANLRVG